MSSRLTFQQVLYSSAAILAALTASSSAALAREQAHMADAFVDSIGVNTHFGQWVSPYQQAFSNVIVPAFIKSGIRHLRDQVMPVGQPSLTAAPAFLATTVRSSTGIRLGFNLVGQVFNCANIGSTAAPSSTLSWIPASNIDAFEGLNEYLTSIYSCPASFGPLYTQDATFQKALYKAVQSTSSIASIPVIGPSLAGSLQGLIQQAQQIGDLSAFMNYGNIHPYSNSHMPSLNIQYHLAGVASMNGSNPTIATETGYHNDTFSNTGCSEQAAGKYYSRLFFEFFNAGIFRTYAYELIDDPSVATTADAMGGPQANFGLIHSDGTPKPAFTAISNEIALLKDPGVPFAPGALNYTLTNAPSQLHHTLLQKRNGAFYLVLWQEVDSYNYHTKSDISVSPMSVTVTFLDKLSKVKRYDPITSPIALNSVDNPLSVTIPVADKAIILEIVR
jgi:hypothetical protein